MATTSQTTEEVRTAALQAEATAKDTAPIPPAPAGPVTEARDFGEVTKHPDGKLTIKYTTGEVFEGTQDEILDKVSKSNVETKKYAQQLKAEKEAAAKPAPVVAAPTEDEQVAAAVAEYLAKDLGTTREGLKEQLSEMQAEKDLAKNYRESQKFLGLNPDFPNDEASAKKLTDTLAELGLPLTARNLSVAHADCVARKVYTPLTPEQVAAINAQQRGQASTVAAGTPPPNPPAGGSARTDTGNANPYAMSMEDLKKAAMEQSRRQQ